MSDSTVLDLGLVGCGPQHPFTVRLESGRLTRLMQDASRAHRVYELMLITRPGDVWGYVDVVPVSLPPLLAARVERWRARLDGGSSELVAPIPFIDFDAMFFLSDDDGTAEDEAWNARKGEGLEDFADRALASVRVAQIRLADGGPLLSHIVKTVRDGTHPYAYLDRHAVIERGRGMRLGDRAPRDSFHWTLLALLQEEGIRSVTYYGDGDHDTYRLLVTEQRRRAEALGKGPDEALHIRVFASQLPNDSEWGSEIWCQEEGLGPTPDLFIDDAGAGGVLRAPKLADLAFDVSCQAFFSIRDHGSIPEFEREIGDGWVVYRRRRR